MIILLTICLFFTSLANAESPSVVNVIYISGELSNSNSRDANPRLTENTSNGDILVSWMHGNQNSLYIKLLQFEGKVQYKETESRRITHSIQRNTIDDYHLIYNRELNEYIVIYSTNRVNKELRQTGEFFIQKIDALAAQAKIQ